MGAFAEHVAHVDMDAFFVEVERLRRPELRGLAVIVAGLAGRGVVSSASYEARRRGVTSGMPTGQARRLCPQARFVAPDHRAYAASSRQVLEVLESFSPDVEQISVDEAFLEIGGLRRAYADPAAVGATIRREMRARTGLPCSVGLARCKLIAKLASRSAKPDGLLLVPAGTEQAYLHPLPVRSLWGVGEATYARLEELGVRTVGDLAALPRSVLERRLGRALGGHLHDLAWARDDRPVEPGGPAKSVSVEETFGADLTDRHEVEREMLALADRLASRLRAAGVAARTVALKVRFGDFTTISRSRTLSAPLDTAHGLYQAALELLERAGVGGRPVRLLGLGAEQLLEASSPRQLGLDREPWRPLEEAVDRVRGRYGRSAVRAARLAPAPQPPGRKCQKPTKEGPGR